MPKKNILVIDDEKVVHLILKTVLSKKYQLFFAETAQEGIDILAEQPIHLILLDIVMPRITGMELLQTIMVDAALGTIPVIMMTGDASNEIEIKARQLGAAEFVEKKDLFDNKKNILALIEQNISSEDLHISAIKNYKDAFKRILLALLSASEKEDFLTISQKLGTELYQTFDINYFLLFTLQEHQPKLLVSLKDGSPKNFEIKEKVLNSIAAVIKKSRKPYLNNSASLDLPLLLELQSENPKFNSEIGVPLFCVTKNELAKYKWNIPEDTPLFGFIILKRNIVFSSKDFKMFSRFILQTGALLYELYESEVGGNQSSETIV